MSISQSHRTELNISGDCELEHYVKTLTWSSNRVRYVMLLITVASVLLFVGYRNSRADSWFNSRLQLSWLAIEHELWRADGAVGFTPQDPEQARLIEVARAWVESRNFESREQVVRWLDNLLTQEVQQILNLTMPFLGIRFDVNDLGALGGIGLTILMLVLVFSTSREHENLFLCLWKVRRLSDLEEERGNGASKANLLYHALAMGQVFGKPPTLARWQQRFSRYLTKTLFFPPLIVQTLIFIHDVKTSGIAMVINPKQAKLNLAIQLASLTAMLIFTVVSCLYSRASDLRWRDTFFYINPQLEKQRQPPWRQWIKLGPKPPQAGRRDPDLGRPLPAPAGS